MAVRAWTRRSVLGIGAAAGLPGATVFLREVERLAQPVGGRLGFAAHHLESFERFSIRGGERFPMASVYKLPIAIELLHQVDRGNVSLQHVLHLTPSSLRLGLGNSEVEERVGETGYDFTIGELLERMLTDSDNASSDALLRVLGPQNVTERMAALGVPEIRVDREEARLLLDFVGAPSAEPPSGWTLEVLRRRYRSAGPEQRRRAMANFLNDPRDTATPDAMVELLAKIQQRTVLGEESGELLLRLLKACRTGGRRLRGDLPANAVFVHRTGTTDTTDGITAATNDVGILRLPNGRGHVAIAVFLRAARGKMADRERVFAAIGRAIHDRYAAG